MTVEITEETFDDFVEKNEFVLIDCWAPWCGPCRRMGPIIEELASISQEDIAVGKLDTDMNPVTSIRFGIQSIPTVLIFKNGKNVDTLVGFDSSLTPKALRARILSN